MRMIKNATDAQVKKLGFVNETKSFPSRWDAFDEKKRLESLGYVCMMRYTETGSKVIYK